MYKSIVWLALCSICTSLDDQHPCQDSCDTTMLSASLGSSVLLPCPAPFPGWADWVLWVQNAGTPLVNLTSQGKVQFLEPRHGRVKAFPNEGYVGNFTIRIDGVQESDLGCYQCGQGDGCHQVVVQKHEADVRLPLYITAGVTTFLLLICVCCICSRRKVQSRPQRERRGIRGDNNNQQPIHGVGLISYSCRKKVIYHQVLIP